MENEHTRDHDLLIKLNTQMDTLIRDVKEMKDNTAKRVDDLEADKVSMAQLEQYRADGAKIHDDHEARLRNVENIFESFKGKYAILAVIGMAIVSLIVTYVSKHI